jgi:hypothetical protein
MGGQIDDRDILRAVDDLGNLYPVQGIACETNIHKNETRLLLGRTADRLLGACYRSGNPISELFQRAGEVHRHHSLVLHHENTRLMRVN